MKKNEYKKDCPGANNNDSENDKTFEYILKKYDKEDKIIKKNKDKLQ